MTRKKLFMITAIAAAFIIIISAGLALGSCSDDGKFDSYLKQGQLLYQSGDYEKAASSLDSALALKRDETAYMLLADCFIKLNNIDGAIRVLYSASLYIPGYRIDTKLEAVKAMKVAGGGGFVVLAGKSYRSDASELSLSGLGLDTADTFALTKFPVLSSLDLAINKITDLKNLSGLTRLQILYLDDNPITDVTPLYSLKNLTYLSIKGISLNVDQQQELRDRLPGCSIHCDDPIAKEITLGGKKFMSDVTELNLSDQALTDISALADCTALKKLNLTGNSLSDVSALLQLKTLTELSLSANSISDIRQISDMTWLIKLELADNPLGSITAITGLVNLTDLDVSGCGITDISPLLWLSSLKKLGLKNSDMSDKNLDTLARIKTLAEINLENNPRLTGDAVEALKSKLPGCTVTHSQLVYELVLGGVKLKSDALEIGLPSAGITSLAGLEKFTKLSNLMLADNHITDISPLTELKDLQKLDLDNSTTPGGNKISDISPLKNHTELRVFSAVGNNISDISALSGCVSLTELHLSSNPLRYGLSSLSSLTSLTVLSLDNTGISDISVLSGLTNLTYLGLDGNAISSLTPLKSLTKLQTLYVSKNSLTLLDIIDLQSALPGCRIYSDLSDMFRG